MLRSGSCTGVWSCQPLIMRAHQLRTTRHYSAYHKKMALKANGNFKKLKRLKNFKKDLRIHQNGMPDPYKIARRKADPFLVGSGSRLQM